MAQVEGEGGAAAGDELHGEGAAGDEEGVGGVAVGQTDQQEPSDSSGCY